MWVYWNWLFLSFVALLIIFGVGLIVVKFQHKEKK
jgi:uncharacterized protein YpmS